MASGKLKAESLGYQNTYDVLSDALDIQRLTYFIGSGDSYTGSVPNNNLKYGGFIAGRRTNNRFVIGLSPAGDMYYTVYKGNSWTDWEKVTRESDKYAFTTATPTALNSSTYTSFPTDGYVKVVASTQTSMYFSGYDYVKILDTIVPAGQTQLFFVKQGMIGKINSGNATATYYPMRHV